eukprot:13298799-Alexandrium_andersonii.AAC.1
MSASLVGSEMCIRDRCSSALGRAGKRLKLPERALPVKRVEQLKPNSAEPVSYTHLTLPTICSV